MEVTIVFRLVVAAVLAAPLGWERERRDRPAGLRTHMLVAVSCALFAGLAESFPSRDGFVRDNVQMDPLRVLEAITTGVSFLGAGTVFVSRTGGVRGLTTAASLLLVGALGVSVGFGLYLVAGTCALLGLVILAAAARLSRGAGMGRPPGGERVTVANER